MRQFSHSSQHHDSQFETPQIESVQDFLIKLGIKPLMHLVEISTCSLDNVIIRLTKIMSNLVKDLNFFEKKYFKVLYLLKMCPIFAGSFHNFGKFDNDIIY